MFQVFFLEKYLVYPVFSPRITYCTYIRVLGHFVPILPTLAEWDCETKKEARMTEKVIRVCVTGAAGQIAYSLLPHICLGRTFGTDKRVILHLLDIERAQVVCSLSLLRLFIS